MSDLTETRGKIDSVDRQIIDLLAERKDLVAEVIAYKKVNGGATYDPQREKDMIASLAKYGQVLGLSEIEIVEIFNTIIACSRARQDLERGLTKKAPVEIRYCMPCEWNTSGEDGPPGSTKRVCSVCKTPLAHPRKVFSRQPVPTR